MCPCYRRADSPCRSHMARPVFMPPLHSLCPSPRTRPGVRSGRATPAARTCAPSGPPPRKRGTPARRALPWSRDARSPATCSRSAIRRARALLTVPRGIRAQASLAAGLVALAACVRGGAECMCVAVIDVALAEHIAGDSALVLARGALMRAAAQQHGGAPAPDACNGAYVGANSPPLSVASTTDARSARRTATASLRPACPLCPCVCDAHAGAGGGGGGQGRERG
jgi:hypothetical protein